MNDDICPWCGQHTKEDEINEAVEFLIREFEKGKRNKTVKTPLPYALYHTWRYYDSKAKKGAKQ